MTTAATSDFGWTRSGPPRDLLDLLNQHGEARFVGGCVRDSLIGLPPGPAGRTDIDIATTLMPPETISVLEAAGIRTIPTGIEHGTVTAVIDRTPFEITTLRADVSTDGRRAVVAFTTDWREDSCRRDFTINALYLDGDGQLTDFHGGRDDLAAGRVRFIGRADDRIAEDYLRILRFLRFSARYAPRLDDRDWSACVALKTGIDTLSKERIWSETSRLFAAPRAPMALEAASRDGVLGHIVPDQAAVDMFAKVHSRRRADVPPTLGLAALWPDVARDTLQAAFKPSVAELDGWAAIGEAAHAMNQGLYPRHCLYRFGEEICALAADLAAERFGRSFDEHMSVFRQADVPALPLKGADFVSLGINPGPEVGKALKRFEDDWIAAGFPEDPETISRLAERAAKPA